jgi:hypothetical protein
MCLQIEVAHELLIARVVGLLGYGAQHRPMGLVHIAPILQGHGELIGLVWGLQDIGTHPDNKGLGDQKPDEGEDRLAFKRFKCQIHRLFAY